MLLVHREEDLGLTATEKMPAEEEDFQANGCF